MMLPKVRKADLKVRSLASRDPRRFMNAGEVDVLLALIGAVEPRVVVEIGVNEGLTARAILDWVPTVEDYVGIDVPPGYVPECEVQRHEIPSRPGLRVERDPRFHLMVPRRGSLDVRPAELGPVDAFFIDGDHGRAAVEHDSALARAVVQPGGVCIWHDYHDLGTVAVRDVLDEMFRAGRKLRHVEETWLAYERY